MKKSPLLLALVALTLSAPAFAASTAAQVTTDPTPTPREEIQDKVQEHRDAVVKKHEEKRTEVKEKVQAHREKVEQRREAVKDKIKDKAAAIEIEATTPKAETPVVK